MSVHKPPSSSKGRAERTAEALAETRASLRRLGVKDRAERTSEALSETRASLDRTAVVQAKKVFKELVERAPGNTFKRPVHLVVDDETALQGRVGLDEGGRACAAATADTVYISRALLNGRNDLRLRGVLAHELGHVHLLQHGNEGHSERAADEAARQLLGVVVGYDEDDVQTSGPGTHPRPAHLDRRRNPGHDHGDCVL